MLAVFWALLKSAKLAILAATTCKSLRKLAALISKKDQMSGKAYESGACNDRKEHYDRSQCVQRKEQSKQ